MRRQPRSLPIAPRRSRRAAATLGLAVLLAIGSAGSAGASAPDATAAATAPPSVAGPTPDQGERISTLREETTAIGTRYRPGQRLTQRIRVANPSSRTARGVEVCDALPRGLRFVRATPGFRFREGRLCWTRTIAARRTVELRIVGQVVGPRG